MIKPISLLFIILCFFACKNDQQANGEQQVAQENKNNLEEDIHTKMPAQITPNYPPFLIGDWKLTMMNKEVTTDNESYELTLMEDHNLLMQGNNKKLDGIWSYEKIAETAFLKISLDIANEERTNKILSLDEQKMVLHDQKNRLTFERIEQ